LAASQSEVTDQLEARLAAQVVDRGEVGQHVERERGVVAQALQALAHAPDRDEHGGVAAVRVVVDDVGAEQRAHLRDQLVGGRHQRA